MIKRKTQINIQDFPPQLHSLLQGGDLYDSSCSGDARTLYCDAGYYIKIAAPGTLALEADLNDRFHRLGLGVPVIRYSAGDRDYLVTQAAEGEDLTHCVEDPERLCRVLAEGLRRLHSQPAGDAPVSAKLRQYGEAAEKDLEHSGYEEYLLMERFGLRSKADAWNRVQRHGGEWKQDTLIHGDACLPNVICRDGRFSAFIDCGLGGAGDRHIDLFWAVWSLQFNLKTDGYTDHFLDLYGRDNFDFEMLKTVAAFEMLG